MKDLTVLSCTCTLVMEEQDVHSFKHKQTWSWIKMNVWHVQCDWGDTRVTAVAPRSSPPVCGRALLCSWHFYNVTSCGDVSVQTTLWVLCKLLCISCSFSSTGIISKSQLRGWSMKWIMLVVVCSFSQVKGRVAHSGPHSIIRGLFF